MKSFAFAPYLAALAFLVFASQTLAVPVPQEDMKGGDVGDHKPSAPPAGKIKQGLLGRVAGSHSTCALGKLCHAVKDDISQAMSPASRQKVSAMANKVGSRVEKAFPSAVQQVKSAGGKAKTYVKEQQDIRKHNLAVKS